MAPHERRGRDHCIFKAPPPGQSNLSAYGGWQFFGKANIDGRSADMTVDLRDISGMSVFRRREPTDSRRAPRAVARPAGRRRATRVDVIRQFVLGTMLLAVGGGILGLGLGVALSRIIAGFAGWSTIVTGGSLTLAFLVSVIVGLVSGIYPAVKASRLDPVQALHDE
jgi:hypothetical protein